jgi:hypothetical protein
LGFGSGACTPGASEKLPQDGTQAENHGNVSHEAAHTRCERSGDLAERHARGYAESKGGDCKSQSRVKTNLCDQEQKKQHRAAGTG